MIAFIDSPSKLEGVAAARRSGACVHRIPRRGESLFAPTEYTNPPPHRDCRGESSFAPQPAFVRRIAAPQGRQILAVGASPREEWYGMKQSPIGATDPP